MARPVRATTFRPSSGGSELDRRVRPVLGQPLLVGKSLEAAAEGML
jgi:hypothetical protein